MCHLEKTRSPGRENYPNLLSSPQPPVSDSAASGRSNLNFSARSRAHALGAGRGRASPSPGSRSRGLAGARRFPWVDLPLLRHILAQAAGMRREFGAPRTSTASGPEAPPPTLAHPTLFKPIASHPLCWGVPALHS